MYWNSYSEKCSQYLLPPFTDQKVRFVLHHAGLLLVLRSHLIQWLCTVVLQETTQTHCNGDHFIGFLFYWFRTNAAQESSKKCMASKNRACLPIWGTTASKPFMAVCLKAHTTQGSAFINSTEPDTAPAV